MAAIVIIWLYDDGSDAVAVMTMVIVAWPTQSPSPLAQDYRLEDSRFGC